MALITIILGLFTERFLGALDDYRRFGWFERYCRWMVSVSRHNTLLDGWFGAAGTILGFVLLVALVDAWLSSVFGLAGFLFGVLVFIYCLGPKGFYNYVSEFCNAIESGNAGSAKWYVELLMGRELTADEQNHMPFHLMQSLFLTAHHRLFAVIFWFVLFGPAGAAFYRLTHLAQASIRDESAFAQALSSIYFWISWPTARLTALSYAMTGNFVDGLAKFKSSGAFTSSVAGDDNDRVLIASGLGAMGVSVNDIDADFRKVAATMALLRRTGIFVLGLIALATLAGWVS